MKKNGVGKATVECVASRASVEPVKFVSRLKAQNGLHLPKQQVFRMARF